MSEDGASASTTASYPPEDIPGNAWDNSVSFPLSDPPEAVATIRIEPRDYTRAALYSMLELLSRAAVPVNVQFSFGTPIPPPIFVTVADAAKALGIPEKHMKTLIMQGWLSPVHHQDHERRSGTTLKRALENDQWPGWELRVVWTELVALAEWCARNRHIPTYEAPLEMRKWHRHTKGRLVKKPNWAEVVRRELASNVDENGEQEWTSIAKLHAKLDKEWDALGGVSAKTIQSAVTNAMSRGLVERKRIQRKWDPRIVLHNDERRHRIHDERAPERGLATLYRWVPEANRIKWEEPPEELRKVGGQTADEST